MSVSLGEAEATARKATRGAGFDWGTAEEAGRAVCWLCTYGLDGCGALADWLDATDRQTSGIHRQQITDGNWRAETVLCPLLTGMALADHGHMLQTPLVLHDLARPLLILPFADDVARLTGKGVLLVAQEGRAWFDGTSVQLAGSWDLSQTAALHVTFEAMQIPAVPRKTRANPEAGDWQRLEAWAHKTYAPATDASRVSGAGAGLTDND